MILLLAVKAGRQVANRCHNEGTEGESIAHLSFASLQVVSVIPQLLKHTVNVALVLANHISIARAVVAAFLVATVSLHLHSYISSK